MSPLFLSFFFLSPCRLTGSAEFKGGKILRIGSHTWRLVYSGTVCWLAGRQTTTIPNRKGKHTGMRGVCVVASGYRIGSWWIAHREKPVAELEGGSVVFFVVLLGLRRVEDGNNAGCRVISYAWNWILGSRPLIGRNRVLDLSCALYINVTKM